MADSPWGAEFVPALEMETDSDKWIVTNYVDREGPNIFEGSFAEGEAFIRGLAFARRAGWATDEDEQIRVVQKDDGLWLLFGAYAAMSLDSILAHHAGPDVVRVGSGPIVQKNVRAVCKKIAEIRVA